MIDPVALQVVKGRLDVIAEEMQLALMRSAYSPSVKEAGDCSSGLLDPTGQLIAQGTSNPVHLGSLEPAAQGIMRDFPMEQMQDGDVYILNDPYCGGQHLPDIIMLVPFFDAQGIVGFGCTLAHHQDMGGSAPGSNPTDTTEIYQEGLRIPPTCLYRAGELNEAVRNFIQSNVRIPQLVWGDVRAQLAACLVAKRRMLDTCAEFGRAQIVEAMRVLLDMGEAMTRREIEAIPDGTYSFYDFLDNDGVEFDKRVRIQVAVTVRGSDLHVDFSGSSPQTRGPFNSVPPVALSAVRYVVRVITDPSIPKNSGCSRMISMTLPPRSVVNPDPPAAVNCRAVTLRRMVDALLGAMVQALPGKIPAANNGHPLSQRVGGYDPAARRMFVYSVISTGGMGARPTKDGVDAIQTDASNSLNVPIEYVETLFPVRCLHYGLANDSGGAGRHRGGLGLTLAYELLHGEVTVSHRGERYYTPPWGLFGGRPGAKSSGYVLRRDGTRETIHSKGVFQITGGDRYYVETTGGGGYGDPLERPPAHVLADVLDRKVTAARAREVYGVALAADGWAVDAQATAKLRAELAARRGAITWVHDRGDG
ncbi:MAG: hydantoinase B/oxoprolinase family protein [Chloroflexi bacterium]|nr:hydantoinase B/oxoprolinase family protein [Chloroflexota bacterium]